MATLRTSVNIAYLLLTAVLVAAIALGFLVYSPAIDTLVALQTKIEKTEQSITERQQFLTTLQTKVVELQRQAEGEKILDTVLPTIDQEEDVLRLVQQAAGVAGVTINAIRNQSAEEGRNESAKRASGTDTDLPGTVRPLAVEVTVLGSYPQVRGFLQNLERAPRLIDVQTIDLQSREGDNNLRGSLSLRFYKLGEINTSPSVPRL